MKVKKMLRFYFSADSLDRTINNLIIKKACDCFQNHTEFICNLIGEKQALAGLWGYLENIINGLTSDDVATLKDYAGMRCGIKKLGEFQRREIKRAATKFSRRLRRLDAFSEALGAVEKYYCILSAG